MAESSDDSSISCCASIVQESAVWLDFDLYRRSEDTMDRIQGLALVASPYLADPNFCRSVIYMLRHDEEGALGLILNRPTDATVGCLLGQLTEQEICNETSIYCGGPVDGPLVMLEQVEIEHRCCVAVASDQDRILQVCSQCSAGQKYRLFDGYSGWGAGQLEAEIEQGGWLIWEIEPDDVFSDPDELWRLALQAIGRDVLASHIDPSRIPEDPAFN